MLLTEDQTLNTSDSYSNSHQLFVEDTISESELDDLLDSYVYEDFEGFQGGIQDEKWLQQLETDWQCIASDYSVQYKRMSEHYHSLHTNNLAIDLNREKNIGEYKIVDITRCSYEVHEGQYIRVSVNAKLVYQSRNGKKETPIALDG